LYAIEFGLNSAAEKFGLSGSTIYKTCKEFNFKPCSMEDYMDHGMRRERRRQAALHAEEFGLSSAAEKFDISYDAVSMACKEFGLRAFRPLKASTFEIIKCLLDGMSPLDISKRCAVSRQYIYKIRGKCLEVGIKLPQANED
jgi:transposase